MVALGTSRGMKMHKMDVTTAFLYAPLEEEVYMEQPEGTVKVGDEGKVMRLLKQSPIRTEAVPKAVEHPHRHRLEEAGVQEAAVRRRDVCEG